MKPQKKIGARTLIKGFVAGLPTAQALIKRMNHDGHEIDLIAAEKIAKRLKQQSSALPPSYGPYLGDEDIDALSTHTPLFLYILLEAEAHDALGPLASEILCQCIKVAMANASAQAKFHDALPKIRSMPEMISLIQEMETLNA